MPGSSFRNWNRNFACRPRERLGPETVDGVVALVRRARAAGLKVRPVGSGYSYTPLVATDDLMVDLSGLDRVGPVDWASGTVIVGAGIRLDRLTEALAAQGAALENAGDIDRQTLAGAIATGTHGSGISLGSLSSQVAALTVVDGRGEVVELDERTPDLLPAARIGLGALGIVVAVTLRVRRHGHLRLERLTCRIEDVLPDLDGALSANRNFEFFWYAGDNLVYRRLWNDTSAAEATDGHLGRIVRFLDEVVLENLYVWGASAAVRRWPRLRPAILKAGWSMVPSDVQVRPAERSYATPRYVRHHETEYAIPLGRAAEVLAELAALHRDEPAATTIPLQIRFVAAEDIPLSPSQGRDVMYVAVHAWRKAEWRDYFARCERLFLRFDGRPHWGKLHSLTAADLKARYPRWGEFQAARRRLDPDGVFLNDYLIRLLDPT